MEVGRELAISDRFSMILEKMLLRAHYKIKAGLRMIEGQALRKCPESCWDVFQRTES